MGAGFGGEWVHVYVWLNPFTVFGHVVMLVAQSCPALRDPMDCSPPGSSVHEIFQIRIWEWVAIPFSRRIFPTQGSDPSLPHCRQIFYEVVCTLFSVILKCALGIFQVVLLVMEKAMSTHSSTLA